jgi:hypothetical protein
MPQAGGRVDLEVKFALRANLQVVLQGFAPDDLAATVALQPQPFRADGAGVRGDSRLSRGLLSGEPSHS